MSTLMRHPVVRLVLAGILAGPLLFLAIGRTAGQAPVFGAWTALGPAPFDGLKADDTTLLEVMSGQPSSIAVDLVNDPTGNTVYVATAGGGVWKSTNGLAESPQFTLLSDPTLPASAGAVALDSRTNPPTIYVGTGDPDNPSNGNAYAGNGVLVSRDGGTSWTLVESADGGVHPFKGMGISRILVDPGNPSVLLAATGVGSDVNFAPSAFPQRNPAFDHLGIYRSADAGASWSRVKAETVTDPDRPYNLNAYFHIDLVHEPVRGVFIAGISGRGLWASEDGLAWRTFAEAGLPTQGLPAPAGMHRISLAARGGNLWALVLVLPYPDPTDPCGEGLDCEFGRAHRLYELANGAEFWREVPKPRNLQYKGFLGYVAAPPGSAGLVAGGVLLHRTDDIAVADPLWSDIEYSPLDSLHGDQHAIAFVDADRWYVGDDGGLFVTTDRGSHWRSLNETLRTTEYYSAAADSAGTGAYAGGQQDNGQSYSADGARWHQFFLGDGTYTRADPRSPSAFFTSAQFGGIFYLPVPPAPPPVPQLVLDFAADRAVSGGAGGFLTPFEVLPADPRLYEAATPPAGFDFGQARFLLTGNTNPWLAAFVPGSGPAVTHRLTDQLHPEVLTYLAPDPRDATTAYIVTRSGPADERYTSSLLRLRNIGLGKTASVQRITKPDAASETPATDILGHAVMSPVCSEGLYVVKTGWVEGRKIFKTTTGGAAWTNISGNLPNVPVHWIALDPVNPDFVYVGTNVGAFLATDGGVNGEQWQPLGSGLPNVPVMELSVSPTRQLVAATYGRGVWTLDLPELTPWTPKAPAVSGVSASVSVLWPPDHRLVEVAVDYAAADDCGVPTCALSVASSEAADGLGDGDEPVDSHVVDAHRVRLRAERAGTGPGRTYTITVACTGTDGLVTTASTAVRVPHDQKQAPLAGSGVGHGQVERREQLGQLGARFRSQADEPDAHPDARAAIADFGGRLDEVALDHEAEPHHGSHGERGPAVDEGAVGAQIRRRRPEQIVQLDVHQRPDPLRSPSFVRHCFPPCVP